MNPAIVDDFVAPKCNDDIAVIYEDDAILVINKPSGLFTLSGKNPANWDSVHYRLTKIYPEALMVHRLDLGTSGLLVVARSKEHAKHLNLQFQNRTVLKRYEAELFGLVEEKQGEVTASIAKDEQLFPRLKVCEQTGKKAHTQYRVVHYLQGPERTRVEFIPHTGRTHQLRIHSAFMGHPIVGCDLYGSKETEKAGSRLKLHASSIQFHHPVSNERVTFTVDCPF